MFGTVTMYSSSLVQARDLGLVESVLFRESFDTAAVKKKRKRKVPLPDFMFMKFMKMCDEANMTGVLVLWNSSMCHVNGVITDSTTDSIANFL